MAITSAKRSPRKPAAKPKAKSVKTKRAPFPEPVPDPADLPDAPDTGGGYPLGYHFAFPAKQIDPSPFQKRPFPDNWEQLPETRVLVESIRALGIQQPLVGRPSPVKPGRVELIAGERRLNAARIGLAEQLASEDLRHVGPINTLSEDKIHLARNLIDLCNQDVKDFEHRAAQEIPLSKSIAKALRDDPELKPPAWWSIPPLPEQPPAGADNNPEDLEDEQHAE